MCGDGVLVTTDVRGITMRVTSVRKFPSEFEAWLTLGRYVLPSAEVTWSPERVMLYFSRFYRSDRKRPSVVVVGFEADPGYPGVRTGLLGLRGGEAVERRYRGCGYPWPYNIFVPRPVFCWRSPVPMPTEEPNAGWEAAMEEVAGPPVRPAGMGLYSEAGDPGAPGYRSPYQRAVDVSAVEDSLAGCA